jgi:hypothetical protein
MSGLLIGYARVSSDAQDLTARGAAAAGDDPDVLRMGTWTPTSHRSKGDGGDPGRFAHHGESNTRKGDSMAKAAAGGGGAESSVADQLRAFGVKGVLVQMAERGQLLALRCEMPQCYHHKGRGAFDPVTTPRTKWAPSPDHYPILKSAGGQLVPENVRLSHVWCNNRDYGWRTQIRTLLAKGKSLDEIAEALNRKGVPPAHGTNRWTAAMVRKAYVS